MCVFFRANKDAGVPIKLLFQGEGHVVTVELKNGEVYRGQLAQAEDTMNCQLTEGKSINSISNYPVDNSTNEYVRLNYHY